MTLTHYSCHLRNIGSKLKRCQTSKGIILRRQQLRVSGRNPKGRLGPVPVFYVTLQDPPLFAVSLVSFDQFEGPPSRSRDEEGLRPTATWARQAEDSGNSRVVGSLGGASRQRGPGGGPPAAPLAPRLSTWLPAPSPVLHIPI